MVRTYDNVARREQASRRRTAILDACRELLVSSGYAGLTIKAVAAAAEVSPETIYKAFGTKRGLVKAMYDVTLAGDDAPEPLARRPEVLALLAETDPSEKIFRYAVIARGIGERLGAVTAALGSGGPEAAAIVAETGRERLAGATAFARHLAEGGHLTRDVDVVADEAWVLLAPEVYQAATAGRGWTPDRYEDWLRRVLTATFLA
ncbi:TetR/AcrR family transcriptional regulator [Actinoplanes bogorensis]|uniref:TetR/AcrR family transcriptional regulator n=1 Tax=Paractinoplanes bogorensis TaxID=1610840 RepID=A0ABS5Z3Y2_9ACTN|nr:TetR/AcrR family transcriptional regulator [Actinoplanes bogorensis]MBU2669120.1 TetR/AcrR family transcriptional regulator [Actinoplanes bogorensis]